MQEFNQEPRHSSQRSSGTSLLGELERLLLEYLAKRPHMSVSAVSRRSGVSEPTLRRIKNQQFRTLPTHSTILNLLHYVSGETSVVALIKKYPGPIAEYLKEMSPQYDSQTVEYNPILNETLRDNVAYGIFKLATNTSGVTSLRVERLFGAVGLSTLKSLKEKGLIEQRETGKYHSKLEWFMLDPEQFSEKFRYLAQFIKSLERNPEDSLLQPIQANYSCSVSAEAYRSIAKLQGKFLKKVREILESDQAQGPIPLMLLAALDTMDTELPSGDFYKD